jgi:pyruvate formate-lyase activating enzyme-like uncharacterized protein
MNKYDNNIHQQLIEANRREYGRLYDLLDFADSARITEASAERQALLAWLGDHALFGCAGTKVDCNRLSPGCRSCGEGAWSCLFVNGRCNGKCFYCPTPQDDGGPPVTNGLIFESPDDYAAYVHKLGFSGVSISGGEPLLTPDLTISFIEAVRKRCGNSVHIWIYTNGTMLTDSLCRRLQQAGLNEIRFDIGAVRYNLKKLEIAVGLIPVVTVEIPAVPEEEKLLRQKIVEMSDAGVNHLNLHQLRLTPHNFGPLIERGYSFLHGEKVTVLDSELAALRLVKYSIEAQTGLPVNYCSFPYKRRFQHAAARRRAAMLLCSGDEKVTESGYLRTVADNMLRYSEAAILQSPGYSGHFEKLVLETGRVLYVEKRQLAADVEITAVQQSLLESGNLSEQFIKFEKIPSGLADYF